MLDLELATTEQILEELGRRPIHFVHVCTMLKNDVPDDGYIAYSRDLEAGDAIHMLRRAQQLLAEEEPKQSK